MGKISNGIFSFLKKHWHIAVLTTIAFVLIAVGYMFTQYSLELLLAKDAGKTEIIRNLIFGLGALGAFYGIILATLRQITFSKQVDEQTRQIEITKQQSANEILARGFDLLANDNITLRRSGIRVLEDLAKNSSEYARQIFNVLVDYVEEKAKIEYNENRETSLPEKPRKDKADIELAITVLLKIHKEKFFEFDKAFFAFLDLRDLHFSNLDFSGMNFHASCLQNTFFSNCKFYNADLTLTKLKGTLFANTPLNGANITLADFEGQANSDEYRTLMQDEINSTVFSEDSPPENLPRHIELPRDRAFIYEDGKGGVFVHGMGKPWSGHKVDEWIAKEIAEAEAKKGGG